MKQSTKERFRPKRILVPVDFSPSSDVALNAAAELASEFEAALSLLHVVPLLSQIGGESFLEEDQVFEQLRSEAEEKLRKNLDALRMIGIKASCRIESGNDIVGNILFVVHRERTDLLVLSTHGLTGWRPFVFGSIAEKVFRQAVCPILLIPAVRKMGSQPASVSQAHEALAV